jgi:hypothetical protein
MKSTTAVVVTIESDHTIKVPDHFPVGEQVMLLPIPSISALLHDAERRMRYTATRLALQKAVQAGFPPRSPSDSEIVALVKRARKATTKV